MRIKIQGKIPEYELQCPYCKTVYIVTDNDAIRFFIIYFFKCPVCSKWSAYVKEDDADA